MDYLMSMIVGWGPNWAPRGWELCQGQLMAISSNTALFSLIGTTYGGDGRTTFALPDLRGRVAVGAGQGPGTSHYQIGARGGVENVSLNVLEMPNHNHSAVMQNTNVQVKATDTDGDSAEPKNGYVLANVPAIGREQANIYSSNGTPNVNLNTAGTVSGDIAVGASGGSQPHENRQPYTVINYIMCVQGIFPSRN